MTRFARPLSELILATYGVASQQRPEPAAVPGMLWAPSGAGQPTGTVPGRRSLWTALRLAAAAPVNLADAISGLRRVVRSIR